MRILYALSVVLAFSTCQRGPTVEEYCARAADFYGCDQAKACGELSGAIACADWGGNTQPAGCYASVGASLERGRLHYDPGAAAQCLAQVECTWDHDTACSHIFTGLVGAGGTCTALAECAPGLECAGSTCPGTCEPIQCPFSFPLADGGCTPFVKRPLEGRVFGETCSASAPCDPSLRCLEGRCALLLQLEGEPCNTSDLLCQLGLFCVEGQCAQGGAVGAACSAARPCGPQAFCDPQGVCQQRGREGAVCRETTDCARDQFCQRNPRDVEGQCQHRGALGDACTSGQGCDSTRGLSCLEGLCTDALCR